MIVPTIASDVILNPNILPECIALRKLLRKDEKSSYRVAKLLKYVLLYEGQFENKQNN